MCNEKCRGAENMATINDEILGGNDSLGNRKWYSRKETTDAEDAGGTVGIRNLKKRESSIPAQYVPAKPATVPKNISSAGWILHFLMTPRTGLRPQRTGGCNGPAHSN
jgi:hypothetical protein